MTPPADERDALVKILHDVGRSLGDTPTFPVQLADAIIAAGFNRSVYNGKSAAEWYHLYAQAILPHVTSSTADKGPATIDLDDIPEGLATARALLDEAPPGAAAEGESWEAVANARERDLAQCRADLARANQMHEKEMAEVEADAREANEAAWSQVAKKNLAYLEVKRLRAALAELVACKDLKDRIENTPFLDQGTRAWHDLRNEYQTRKPLAWAAARAALGEKP